MLVLAGTVKVKPEKRSEAVRAALKMAKASQAEPGCRAYAFYADLEDPNTVLIFECWESDAALQAHFQSPHMAEFNAAIAGFLAALPSFDRYEVSAVNKMM